MVHFLSFKSRTFYATVFCIVAPGTPMVDVPKCSRSPTSVVIVLSPPENEDDVIDGYYVYYWQDGHQDDQV